MKAQLNLSENPFESICEYKNLSKGCFRIFLVGVV